MRSFFLSFNQLPKVDIVFFSICVAVVVAIIGIYFLIPVINRKQYREQRENLKKREASFRANLAPDRPDTSEKDNARNG